MIEQYEHVNENPVSRRRKNFSWNLPNYHIHNFPISRGQVTADRHVCLAVSIHLDCNLYDSLDVEFDTLELCSVLQDVNMARHGSNSLPTPYISGTYLQPFNSQKEGVSRDGGYVYRVSAAPIKDMSVSSVSTPFKVKRMARMSNQDDGLRRSDAL